MGARRERCRTPAREQRTFVVTDDADRWLGLALVRPDDESPGDAVLNAMWVAPEARRRGAARALCDACVGWAAEHGFRALNLAVVIGNDAAQRAYEAAGFVPSHTTTWVEEGRTLEELILTRRLAPAPAALTIAWMRAFSAATPSPTTAAISRGLVPARRIAKIGRSRGSSRPAARDCWRGPTSGTARSPAATARSTPSSSNVAAALSDDAVDAGDRGGQDQLRRSGSAA